MNGKTDLTNFPPKNQASELKEWQMPVVEELSVDQTESDFIAVTDGTSFFS